MPDDSIRNSIVVPVYRNSESLRELLLDLEWIADNTVGRTEVVFVVDGSPDDSFSVLQTLLPAWRITSKLIGLSRNFGSFSAIRAGLQRAEGRYVVVMAADLQDPPEFAQQAFQELATGNSDIAIATRSGRNDPWLSRIMSDIFWGLYRALIIRDIPRGGVDIFACNRDVQDVLNRMSETRTSLVGLLFWVGFRRSYIPYHRRPRRYGKSGWGLKRKIHYMLDSIYSFTDLPISVLTWLGSLGIIVSVTFAIVVLVAWWAGLIGVPGYAPIVLSISFFGALNLLGLGIIGTYIWRAYENTKGRPVALVMSEQHFGNRM
jgi:polyisoprenyl-phosphate glycosyltransferase